MILLQILSYVTPVSVYIIALDLSPSHNLLNMSTGIFLQIYYIFSSEGGKNTSCRRVTAIKKIY